MITDRRNFLSKAGAVGAFLGSTTALPAATKQRLLRSASSIPDLSFDGSACNLPIVQVSEQRVIRTVTGLRPYRLSGFVVKAEKLNDSLVIHNYGHGGAGITLSWGTSKLAVDLGAPGYTGAVAVLGSGAVGLSCARLLQEAGFSVTIYTKALPPQTTSNIAGGQWLPYFVSDPEHRTAAFNEQFLAAAQYAYTRYQIMVGPRFGIRWMRNYFPLNEIISETDYFGKSGILRGMLPEMRDLAPDQYAFPVFKQVRQFDTLLIEPPIYLAAMLDQFLIAGGKIVVQELADRAAIASLPEKLIFNCTGLGAKALFHDDELIPVKGQITVLLPQPEVKYAVCPGDNYMFSRTDGIVLGGTHDAGVWDLSVDLKKKQEILAQHAAFFQGFRACRA